MSPTGTVSHLTAATVSPSVIRATPPRRTTTTRAGPQRRFRVATLPLPARSVVFFTFLVLAMALVLTPWLLLFLPVLFLL